LKLNHITTKYNIINLFQNLGIESGAEVFVHSSLSSLGYVVNGALDVIDALIQVVDTNIGTILMPAHSGQLTDPAGWKAPEIKKELIGIVKTNMKPFNKELTPIRGRGIIPETFFRYPNIERSNHPLNSVIAMGKLAQYFTEVHDLHAPEDLNSPIGRLYNKGGNILLVGVGLSRCTAIHLAEYLVDVPYLYESELKVLTTKNGKNTFTKIKRYPNGSEHFDKLMPDLQKQKLVKSLKYGNAELFYFKIKPVVDFVVARLMNDKYYLINE
jgi:aminoglycoside 3-N-acetyltransferase